MANLSWSPKALADLNDICEFIAKDSPRYSRVFAENVIALIESIPSQPLLGAIISEYGLPELRERAYRGYRIMYRVRERRIEIAAIRHGARLLPASPP